MIGDGVRVAVLDDYQQVAQRMADWSGQLPGARIVYFGDHHADAGALVAAL